MGSVNLRNGIDPYNDQALKEEWLKIASILHLDAKELPGKPDIPFIYPPWAATVFLPVTYLNYIYALRVWTSFLIASAFLIPLFNLKTFKSSPNLTGYLEILILIFAFKAAKGTFLVGQPVFFVVCASFTSLYFYSVKKPVLAGLMLALASFKISIAISFYVFYIFAGIKAFFHNKNEIAETTKIIFTALISLALFTLIESGLLHQSPIQSFIDFNSASSDFTSNYCSRSFQDYSILSIATEWIVFIKYFWGNSICDFLYVRNLVFGGIMAYLFFFKVYIRWSSARLLLAILLANLLTMYHLYYDCLCLILFYLIWTELPKSNKMIALPILLFDLLISQVKILNFLNIESPLLVDFNNYELPLRLTILFIIVCSYKAETNKREMVLNLPQ